MGEVGWCSRDFSQCTLLSLHTGVDGDKQLRGEDGDTQSSPTSYGPAPCITAHSIRKSSA